MILKSENSLSPHSVILFYSSLPSCWAHQQANHHLPLFPVLIARVFRAISSRICFLPATKMNNRTQHLNKKSVQQGECQKVAKKQGKQGTDGLVVCVLQIQEWWKIRQHPTLLCRGELIPRVTQLNLRCQDIESDTLQSHAVLPCKVLSFFFFFYLSLLQRSQQFFPLPCST